MLGPATRPLIGALVTLGCTPIPSEFRCRSDDECRIGGERAVCERSGYCSVADGTCASGRRYGRGAAELTGRCAGCIQQVHAGRSERRVSSTCALRRRDGTVWCWGANGSGQLGDGSTRTRAEPLRVERIDGVAAIGLGDAHACALKGDGTVWCWGANGSGQLGGLDDSLVPRAVDRLPQVVELTVGQSHNCGRAVEGRVWCWGSNMYGAIGDGTLGNTRREPLEVKDLTDAVEIEASYSRTCARKGDGSVWCWGWGEGGQLGNGTSRVNAPAPTRVQGMPGAVELSSGAQHGCARVTGGAMYCWGANGSGQLGTGDTAERNTAVKVLDLDDAVEIATGAGHSCARRADGTLWCWGSNGHGQLGAAGPDRNRPAQVPGLVRVTRAAAGAAHTCAEVADGTLYCWGSNAYGELGDGTTVARPAPGKTFFGCEGTP